MRRRDFFAALGGAAMAWPNATPAQTSGIPTIGVLSALTPEASVDTNPYFISGLAEVGFIEGRNVAIDYRYASGQYDRLPALATELVGIRVVAIATTGGSGPALAAKAATQSVPVIFETGSDPVADGLVASLNRPGGNVTGVTFLATEVDAKRLEVLHELTPAQVKLAVLINPGYPAAQSQRDAMQAAAARLRRQILILDARTESELDAAFATLTQNQCGAVVLASDPFFTTQRHNLVILAARYSVPAIYPLREIVTAGGLMSYGASITEALRQTGIYTARILKGAKPSELPILRSSKFELVINLKTAKALGLAVPPTLLARADEVIE